MSNGEDSERVVIPFEAAQERQLVRSDVGRFLVETGELSAADNIETARDIETRLDGVVSNIMDLLFRDKAADASELIGGINVDFSSHVLFWHPDDHYKEGSSTAQIDTRIGQVNLLSRLVSEDRIQELAIFDYEKNRIISANREESVLPVIIRLENEPKLHIVPTVHGGREFRALSPGEVGFEVEESTKVLFYAAMGIAQAALFQSTHSLNASARRAVAPKIIAGALEYPDKIDGRINLNSFSESRREQVHRNQLVMGVAVHAVARNTEEYDALVAAIYSRYEEEIPSYSRDSSTIEGALQQEIQKLVPSEKDSANIARLVMDEMSSSFRESDHELLSELWLAAGQPLLGAELEKALQAFRRELLLIKDRED